jgi:hypothetical protein
MTLTTIMASVFKRGRLQETKVLAYLSAVKLTTLKGKGTCNQPKISHQDTHRRPSFMTAHIRNAFDAQL